MIQITEIITYLRSKLSPAWRVDGAGSLATAKDDSRLMIGASNEFIPTLFVMIGKFIVKTVSQEIIDQTWDARLVILACLDNTQDRTGKYAQQTAYYLRLALNRCLLNYRYDPDSHPIKAVGDEMVEMDRARYWHKFEFSMEGRYQEADGVQLNFDELNKIIADWNSTSPTADNPIIEDDIEPLYDEVT